MRTLDDLEVPFVPPHIDDLANIEEKKSKTSDKCYTNCLTFAGKAFTVLTVLINLADVTTDIVVAIQFYKDGHVGWAWSVICSLLVANIIYTIAGCEALREHGPMRKIARPLGILILFPIAQIVPLLVLINEKYRAGRPKPWSTTAVFTSSDDDDYDDSKGEDAEEIFRQNSEDWEAKKSDEDEISHAVKEEWQSVRRARQIQRRLRRARANHFRKFGFFYIETFVEAAPQAVIQLLAINFLGTASIAQLASLAMSLFSITSKAFIFSISFHIQVLIFKVALIVHDVFSTFYVFSSILAHDRDRQVAVFSSSLMLSWLSYIWLWKSIIIYGYGLLVGAATGMFVVVKEWRRGDSGDRCRWLVVCFCAIITVGPMLLGAECGKLCWLVLLLRKLEPSESEYDKHQVVFQFLLEEKSFPFWCGSAPRPRLRALLLSAYSSHLSLGFAPSVIHRLKGTVEGEGPLDPSSLTFHSSFAGRHLIHSCDDEGKVEEEQFCCCSCCCCCQCCCKKCCSCPSGDPEEPQIAETILISGKMKFPSCAEITDKYKKSNTPSRWMIPHWCLFIFIYAIGQLYSFVYPFVNVALYYDRHSILEKSCLFASFFCLFISLITFPVAQKYFRYCAFDFSEVFSMASMDQLARWMTAYLIPDQDEMVRASIPGTVLPTEVSAVVASFIPRGSIPLKHLTREECARARSHLKMLSLPQVVTITGNDPRVA